MSCKYLKAGGFISRESLLLHRWIIDQLFDRVESSSTEPSLGNGATLRIKRSRLSLRFHGNKSNGKKPAESLSFMLAGDLLTFKA